MNDQHRRVVMAGLLGTAVFAIVTQLLAGALGCRVPVAIWGGTFITLHFGWARIVGYCLEVMLGVGLAFIFQRYWVVWQPNSRASGLTFGIVVWLFMMSIGMAIFDRYSPLVQNGLMLGPGAFLWRDGVQEPLIWLVASSLYGLTINTYLVSTRLAHR